MLSRLADEKMERPANVTRKILRFSSGSETAIGSNLPRTPLQPLTEERTDEASDIVVKMKELPLTPPPSDPSYSHHHTRTASPTALGHLEHTFANAKEKTCRSIPTSANRQVCTILSSIHQRNANCEICNIEMLLFALRLRSNPITNKCRSVTGRFAALYRFSRSNGGRYVQIMLRNSLKLVRASCGVTAHPRLVFGQPTESCPFYFYKKRNR